MNEGLALQRENRERERERERERDTHTDRQTGRQTERETDRQTKTQIQKKTITTNHEITNFATDTQTSRQRTALK